MYYIKQLNDDGDYIDVNGQRYDIVKANEFYPADGFDGYCQCDALSQALILLGLSIAPARIVEPFVASDYRYSRLRVYDALTSLGIQLTDEQKDRMSMANDLGFDDAQFAAMYDQLKAGGLDVDNMLKGCVL